MAKPMSDVEMKAIRERCDEASPGPWTLEDLKEEWAVKDDWDSTVAFTVHDRIYGEADATFIAHARDDIPALLTEIGRLRTEPVWQFLYEKFDTSNLKPDERAKLRQLLQDWQAEYQKGQG